MNVVNYYIYANKMIELKYFNILKRWQLWPKTHIKFWNLTQTTLCCSPFLFYQKFYKFQTDGNLAKYFFAKCMIITPPKKKSFICFNLHYVLTACVTRLRCATQFRCNCSILIPYLKKFYFEENPVTALQQNLLVFIGYSLII